MNLINLKNKLASYEGLECTKVQDLPNVIGENLVLVKIKDHELHCVDELVVVRESNLTSPAKLKYRQSKSQQLATAQKEIADYLEGLGFVGDGQPNEEFVWTTKSGNLNFTFELLYDEGSSDSIEVLVELCAHNSLIDCEYTEEFGITTLKQFKKEAKKFVGRFLKDLENKDFKAFIGLLNEINKA